VNVVDASSLVAVFFRMDQHHQQVREWYETAVRQGVPLAAPAIVLAEVASGVAQATGRRVLGRRAISWIVESGAVRLLPLSVGELHRAGELAADLGLKGCDAIYTATAVDLGATLITLDEQQLTRSRRVVRAGRPFLDED
jgi:predicted nucleic acid-binding protein